MARPAVLFDLDGTLVDSRNSIRGTMNAALALYGLPTFSAAELDGLIGQGLQRILARKAPPDDAALLGNLASTYRDMYVEAGWAEAALFPGTEGFLRRLRQHGQALATVTNKGQVEGERMLADLGVGHLFDVCIGDDGRRPLKPDGAPVAAACEALGVRRQDAVVVGDTKYDILAGRAAGTRTVGVLWGFGTAASLVEAGAQALVRDWKGLGRALRPT